MTSTTFSTATSVVSLTESYTALTTTFTPPASCTQGYLTQLSSPGYQIWLNEPVPVPNTTFSACYPSEFMNGYTSTSSSSIAPLFSPLVCPEGWHTAKSWENGYIACCESGYLLANPSTTVDSERPAYGGTCYSDFTVGQTVNVTAYDSASITATAVWSATSSADQAYGHVIDGIGQKVVAATTANSTTASNTTASTPAAAATSTSSSTSTTLSGGAIAGAVIGSLAGLALILLLLLFLLHRHKRRQRSAANSGSSDPTSGRAEADAEAAAIAEKSGSHMQPVEVDGADRQLAEKDAGADGIVGFEKTGGVGAGVARRGELPTGREAHELDSPLFELDGEGASPGAGRREEGEREGAGEAKREEALREAREEGEGEGLPPPEYR